MQIPPPSDWITRWAHLIPDKSPVLDVACGRGRHMKWLQERGLSVVGIDRDQEALKLASTWGEVHQADIEHGQWPLLDEFGEPIPFGAIVVTNYLWRPLFPTLLRSIAEGGILIYETFAQGNEEFGKPSRPDFLLQPAELLEVCSSEKGFQIVAYESGALKNPDRCIQRLVAIKSRKVVKMQLIGLNPIGQSKQ